MTFAGAAGDLNRQYRELLELLQQRASRGAIDPSSEET